MSNLIYSVEASRNLLGALLNNPQILLTSKYDITREDFKPFLVHYRLMAVIENLVATGASDIDSMMVSQFVEPYEEVVELFNDNNTFEFIDTIKKMINPSNIEVYYNKVKKLSALRDYKDIGFNIDKYFDVTRDAEEQMGKLDIISLEDIVNHFDGLNTRVKRIYNRKDASKSYIPEANRMKNLVQSFKETPMQGACLQSPYQTTISNGALREHLFLRSGNSGSGKTTVTVGDMCELCATELYNSELGKWKKNLNRQGGGLHIHTESNTETEVSVIYLAYIADVNRSKITKGLMNEDEEERVLRAAEILEESQIMFEYDPKFTIPSIRENIKEYTNNYDIFAVFFDYLSINGKFNVELIKESKSHIPDHQALLTLSEELKHMAEEFKVFIESGTQLNDEVKKVEFADETCLSASKAIKNKIDFGCISTYLKPKEVKQIEQYINKKGLDIIRPNRCVHVYKSRFGDTGYDRIKIFQYVNLGTGRVKDLFCTDENNNLISIARTVKASN